MNRETQKDMQLVRELMKQKRYADARRILMTINDPLAKDWLDTIEHIAPEAAGRKTARIDPPEDIIPGNEEYDTKSVRQSKNSRPAYFEIQAGTKQSKNSNPTIIILALLIVISSIAIGIFASIEEGSINTSGFQIQNISSSSQSVSTIGLSQMRSSVEASELAGEFCSGHIGRTPDYNLNWTQNGNDLTIYINSNVDTVLAIQSPDGTWYCDDDSHGNLDPQLIFENAITGTYAIHAGTWLSSDANNAATIYIVGQ